MKWYFDFISPFAYLQSERLQEFSENEDVECVPVLFAGLLNHWGNIGPAEIPPKRTWTFEHVVWLAHRDGVNLTLPEYHPFNPLPLLRLSIALGNDITTVQRLFRFVWSEGKVPQDTSAFLSLLDEFSINEADINNPKVKSTLLNNGQNAINQNVFGVPTVLRGHRLFWGYDATDMALDHFNRINWPQEKLAAVGQFKEGPGRKLN